VLRPVHLPPGIAGALVLRSMPGLGEDFSAATDEITRCRIGRVVCLAPADEVSRRSPAYAAAIAAGRVAWTHEPFAVADGGVPDDPEAFWALAQRLAVALRAGDRILIHCAAGIGRTGMLATCVLLALGVGAEPAGAAVRAAGSRPETRLQFELVRGLAEPGAHGA